MGNARLRSFAAVGGGHCCICCFISTTLSLQQWSSPSIFILVEVKEYYFPKPRFPPKIFCTNMTEWGAPGDILFLIRDFNKTDHLLLCFHKGFTHNAMLNRPSRSVFVLATWVASTTVRFSNEITCDENIIIRCENMPKLAMHSGKGKVTSACDYQMSSARGLKVWATQWVT